MNSYRNPNNAFSFLPEDTITPAIQNLGQTLGTANQQQIARQEDLRKQFAALLDVSYGDIWAKDQQEVMRDWEKLKSNAIDIFKTASASGVPVNQMKYADLMKQQKDLIRKVETARQYKEDWARAMVTAAQLKKDDKLAPGVMEKFEAEKNNPSGTIFNRAAPMSWIDTQYSPDELLKLQSAILDPKVIARRETELDANGKPRLDANGNPIVHDYYDEANVRGALDNYAGMSSAWKRQVSAPYGGDFEKYKDAIVNLYDKNGMLFSKKSSTMNFGYGTPGTETIPGTKISGGYEYDVSNKNLNYSGKVTLPDGTTRDVSDVTVSKVRKMDDGTYSKKVLVKVENPKWNPITAGVTGEPKYITVEADAPSQGEDESTLNKNKFFLQKYGNTPAKSKGGKKGQTEAQQLGI